MAIVGAPRTPQALLWDKIALIVRESPLARVCKTLQLMDGKSDDFTPWTISSVPALRLSPGGDQAHWSAERQHDAPLICQVELGTATSYAGDMFDLWGLVVRTFFPDDSSVYNALYNNVPQLTYSMEIVKPAWGEKQLGDNTKALYAVGAIVFKQHVNT